MEAGLQGSLPQSPSDSKYIEEDVLDKISRIYCFQIILNEGIDPVHQ